MPDINENRPGYKKTKVGWIPEEWEMTHIGEVVNKLEAGVSVNSTDEQVKDDNEIGILKTSSVYGGEFKPFENKKVLETELGRCKTSVEAGTIIISRMNTPDLVGENAFVPTNYPNLYLPDRLWQTVLSKKKPVASRWLGYIFQSYLIKSRFKSIATGTSGSMKNITKPDVLNSLIPLPPLQEQKKIAAILSTWDTAIQKLEQLIAKKQELKRGLMQQLLTGRRRFPEFVPAGGTKYKETKLGLVPVDWGMVKVAKILKLSSGKTKPKDTSEEGSYPVYGGNGILGYSNEFNSDGIDIIIGRVGEYCGVTRLVVGKKWITDNALVTSFIDSKSVNASYLANWFRFFKLSRLRNKGGQPLISQKPIYLLRIPLPPLSEQEWIVKTLTACDDEIDHLETQKELMQQQKKGLMQQLLTGAVRVNTTVSQT